MAGPAVALRRCVALDPADFAARVWGQAAWLSPAAETGADFADLLSLSAVDELLSRRGLRTPFIRMAKEGTVLPPARFTRSGGAGAGIGDQVADDKVLGQFLDGATIVLQGLHRNWPPLVDFGARLSSELASPVQINAYVTPPQNQGFAAHYDTHDVFVLQVHGSKRWVIHEPVLPSPLPNQNWEKHRAAVAARAAEPPLLDIILSPGDALYLPRGYLHSAAALGAVSIHLTLGVHPVTQFDLLRDVLAGLGEDVEQDELRSSLPPGLDLSDPAVLAPYLARAVTDLVERAGSVDERQTAMVAGRLGRRLAEATRPSPILPLAQAETLSRLGLDDVFVLRAGLRVQLRPEAEGVRAQFLDVELSFDAAMAKAIEHVIAGLPFRARELPGLDEVAQLELMRRLLRAAMVVPVPLADQDG
jgi:hypothetical protein